MNKPLLIIATAALVMSNANAASVVDNINSKNFNSQVYKLAGQVVLPGEKGKKAQVKQLPQPIKASSEYYNYGSAITVSPYVGIRAAYDASDLITNLPSMNEDLKLLEQRQKLENHLHDRGVVAPNRPLLEISGNLAGEVFAHQNYSKTWDTDVNLTGAELDAVGEISSWGTAFLALSYDDNPPATGSRVTNSRVRVSRAFLTVGNLDSSPVYATIGQMYVPFGIYNNYMVTDPLTQSFARVKARALLVGFSKYGFYGSVYGFQGDSYLTRPSINNGGVNVGYKHYFEHLKVDVGAGYLINIADSEGIQATFAPRGFPGFGSRVAPGNKISRRVGAYDIHAKVTSGPYNLVGEYIGVMDPFNANDINFNGIGARISALDVEGAYMFNIFGKPGSIALGYGRTWKALALDLPKHSFMAKFGISLIKDTIESIEFRHDVNYEASDYYTYNGTTYPATIWGGETHRNLVTFKVGFYF